jgi:methylated-DNA-[protein]-cysteine S-methyltransferase
MPEVYYTYYESPLGLIRIGGTETFITEVVFVDEQQDMLH